MKFLIVRSVENWLRMGDLVYRSGDRATAVHLQSPADAEPIPEELRLTNLKQATLYAEHSVVWSELTAYSWVNNLVLHFQSDERCGLGRFPNNVSRPSPSDDPQVSCRLTTSELMEHLAKQIKGTALLHSSRFELVRHLTKQLRVSVGLWVSVSPIMNVKTCSPKLFRFNERNEV